MSQAMEVVRVPCGVILVSLAAMGAFAAPEASLAPAARAVEADRFDEALASIESALEAGTVRASEIDTDPRLRRLREDGEARLRWREVMGRHVTESHVRIAAEAEPGSPMLIRGRVVEGASGSAVSGAVVYLFHTDATGNYAPGQAVGAGSNPRLFAFARTDAQGRFEVRTIKPAAYPGAEESFAHVHYRVDADGFGRSVDEFHPYTRPASEAARTEAIRHLGPVTVVRTEGETLVCEVTIPLSAVARER